MFLALSHLVIHKMSVRFIFVSVVLPLPAVYPPLPSPLFSSSLNETHGTCKGQSAVSDIPSEEIWDRPENFPPDFQVGDYNSLQSFSTAPPPLPLLFCSSVCPVPLSRYVFLVKKPVPCALRALLAVPGERGAGGQSCRSQCSQGCLRGSHATASSNSSAQRHELGSLLREISFLGKLLQRNFLCGQTELPDLKASWKGNRFIMKW